MRLRVHTTVIAVNSVLAAYHFIQPFAHVQRKRPKLRLVNTHLASRDTLTEHTVLRFYCLRRIGILRPNVTAAVRLLSARQRIVKQ